MSEGSVRSGKAYPLTVVTLLALVALVGSVLLVVARPAAAADCDPPMVMDPADGAFAGDAIEITGPSGFGWTGLTSVEVFLGGTSLGSATTGLFGFSWTLNTVVPPLAPGTYTLSYIATPTFGLTYSCNLMEYTVNGFIIIPGITLTPLTTLGILTIPGFTLPPGVTVATTSSTTTTTTTTTTTSTTTTTVADSSTTSVADTTSSTQEAAESTTTSIEDATGTSLVAGAAEDGGGGGGTLIGVLIGLGVAAALGGVWFLGRQSATVGGPPLPPTPFEGDDGGTY